MINFRNDDAVTISKSKKDAQREKLAADIDVFLAGGGEIVTHSCTSSPGDLVDESYLRTKAQISSVQIRQSMCNSSMFGVASPAIVGYRTINGVRIAMYRRADADRFAIGVRSARRTDAA